MRYVLTLSLFLSLAQASVGQLSGPLSGMLGPGVYHIVDTISVESIDTLRLLPGTTFTFDGGYPFRIYGTLLAEGTERDLIVFTTDTLVNPYRWRGLRFEGPGSSGCRLSHCHMNRGYVDWPEYAGGAIYCLRSSPTFASCTIVNNTATWGGGVVCNACSPAFENCLISGNAATDEMGFGVGGGVYVVDSASHPIFTKCKITGNWADRGGGIGCHLSSPTFIECTIADNLGWFDGGGTSCALSSPTFTNCSFQGNLSYYNYPAVVYCWQSSVIFNSTVIAFSNSPGVFFYNSEMSQFNYCDVFGNSGGNIMFWNNDPSNGPAGLGELATTNANGDSCDAFFNIFLNPMFVDTAIGDFHLMDESPCIDAGAPTLPLDPDSTIADIGAFYYHQSAAEPPAILLPTTYALYPNWPNPFNSTTMIRYDVPSAGKVSLTMFNLLGQRVATLFDRHQLAGSHTIAWNASSLPSGLYFCRMNAVGFVQTRKMLLVK